MTTMQILQETRAAEGQIKATLASMVKHGLLTKDKKSDPPGYGLAFPPDSLAITLNFSLPTPSTDRPQQA